MRRTNLHIVEIDEQNKEATIHSRSGSNNVAYLGEAQLFGLMFGPGSYTCLYQKAFERLQIISDIYAHKATLLASKELRQNCKDQLAQAYQTLQTYQTLTNKNDLYDYSSQIAQQNAALERNDCPTLY